MSVIQQTQPVQWDSSSTVFWTVNPAFLQEIKDINRELWSLVRQVRQACDLDDVEPMQITRGLVRWLDDLRDGLALQFSLEDAYGYLRLPELPFSVDGQELCRSAAEARSQHAPLYLRLSDLAEQAEELQFRGVTWADLCKLIQQTRAFDEQLTRHECLENDLIDRCFDGYVRM